MPTAPPPSLATTYNNNGSVLKEEARSMNPALLQIFAGDWRLAGPR